MYEQANGRQLRDAVWLARAPRRHLGQVGQPFYQGLATRHEAHKNRTLRQEEHTWIPLTRLTVATKYGLLPFFVSSVALSVDELNHKNSARGFKISR